MSLRHLSQPRDSSETDFFERFRDACHSNDPKAVLRSLIAWLGRCCEESSFRSIQEFAMALGSDDLAEQMAVLRESVASHSTDWSSGELYRALEEARRKFLDRSALLE